MNIIETIREAPDDAQFYLVRELPNIGKTVQGYGNDNTIKRLKALAESHERLLAAAQLVASNLAHEIVGLGSLVDGLCNCNKCRLTEVIEQAEKLK